MAQRLYFDSEPPRVALLQRHRGLYLRTASRLLAGCVLTFCSLLPFLFDGFSAVTYYLITLAGLTVWVLTVLRTSQGGPSPAWLKPPALIGIAVLIGWGLPGIAPFYDGSILKSLVDLGVGFSLIHSARALGLACLGVLLLDTGVALGVRLSRQFSVPPRVGAPHLGKLWILYLASVAFRVIRVALAGVSYGQDTTAFGAFWAVASMFDTVPYFCLVVALGLKARGQETSWLVRMLVVFELILAFTGGMIKPVLWLVLVALVTTALTRAKWLFQSKKALMWMGLGGVMLVIVVVPISEMLRTLILGGRVDTTSLVEMLSAVATAFQLSWGRGWNVGFEVFKFKFFARQSALIHIVGIVLRDTPNYIPFQGMNKLLVTPFLLIPRALWPGKPVISKGGWFSETYLGYPTGTRTASALSLFAEPYIYAGWLGVVIALIAAGILLGMFYHRTIERTRGVPLLGLATFVAILPHIIDVERDFQSYFLGLVQWWVVAIVLVWFISGSKPSTSVHSSEAAQPGAASAPGTEPSG